MVCNDLLLHLYFVGVPVATSIVIPILIGGSSGGDFVLNIPKSTTRMSDDNGHDKVVRRVYVGLAGIDENMAWRSYPPVAKRIAHELLYEEKRRLAVGRNLACAEKEAMFTIGSLLVFTSEVE